MMRICIVIIVCFSLLSTNYLFDTFEEYISEITAKATNLLRGNSFATREFDSNGIPYSNFARIRKKTVSPFYVVHYGLIYSQAIEPPQGYQYLWEKQGSVKYWNVPPKNELVTEQNFFNSVNWVVNKTYELGLNGAHLYYDFDWPYRNLKSGGLKAPWYSGLTDGMALTLLCRAYVITGNDTYKSAAALLYESVIKPVSKGGSLITLQNGDLWIEEYVENRLSDEYQSKVLNGMIYATFGVLDYEQTFVTKNQLAPALFKSIKNNIIKFDLGWWTSYDLIGTVANLKYHYIHIGLLEDLYKITNDTYYFDLSKKWGKYNVGFIKRNFIKGKPTINSIIMLLEYMFIFIASTFLLLIMYPITGYSRLSDPR